MDEELRLHLEGLEARLLRRVNDNHGRTLDVLAAFRDDLTVLTAITMRVEGSVSALITEVRAMHSRHTRLERRVAKMEGE
jgi:hypothetical protein